MFKILFACFITVVVVSATGCPKLASPILEDCKKTHNLPEPQFQTILTELSELKTPANQPGKCFASCVLNHIMTPAHKLDTAKITEVINCMKSNKVAENVIKTIEDFSKNCNSIAVTDPTCGLAPVLQCLADQNKGPVKCFPKEMVDCLKK